MTFVTYASKTKSTIINSIKQQQTNGDQTVEIKNSFLTTSRNFEITLYPDNSISIEDESNEPILLSVEETRELINFLNYAIEN